jgi:DeoR/GlpR family transcriptional regulator of sugar metabolism
MSNDRRSQILQILDSKGEVQLQQLKETFPEVSVMTLRRDLISLENDGYAIRTYGGAVSSKKLQVMSGEEDAYSRRAAENVEGKVIISQKALPMVESGRSIYFDAGSTIMCLARVLPDDNYSIVTSGVNIGLELIKKQRISVVTLGGSINRNTLSVSGPDAAAIIDRINIDIAFMAASGFSIDSGFTVSNIYECELKRKVVNRAKKVIMLMDVTKINKNLPFTYAGLKDIDTWICDGKHPLDVQKEMKKNNVDAIW